MSNIIIRVVDLQYSINAFTKIDENMDYNIYLNARLSHEAQCKALAHELRHINSGHFFNGDPVGMNEADAAVEQEKSRFTTLPYFESFPA